jgi:hypothetical protein
LFVNGGWVAHFKKVFYPIILLWKWVMLVW